MNNLILITLCMAFFCQLLPAEEYAIPRTSRKNARKLPVIKNQNSFSFVVFGDRTTGNAAGLKVLKQAVDEVNLIRPDFVVMVGDMVQGYNGRNAWLGQMHEFKRVINKLKVPWYPVAGNHDIYWRGKNRPHNEHIGDYEKHFGPVWYAFKHKRCLFIILFTDEGNPRTGTFTFHRPASQTMSDEQFQWLKKTLKKNRSVKHVFIFQHHPRWQEGEYGEDWNRVHRLLKSHGRVSAVFAGHNHQMRFDGRKDGIKYYVMGTTGGGLEGDSIDDGFLHHVDLVTVRGNKFFTAVIPVGSVLDAEKRQKTESHKEKTRITLLPEKEFGTVSEASRTHEFPIVIPTNGAAEKQLVIDVFHSYDDSGDRGMTYQLCDQKGRKVKEGYMSSRDYFTIRHPVTSNEKYTFIVQDLDTSLKGKYAGNGGKIKIAVEY